MHWLFGGLVLMVPVLVSWLAWRRHSLDGAGAVGAVLLSILLYLAGGIRFLAVLLLFFLSSTFFTKVGAQRKNQWEPALYEKGGRRDVWQVLANGGAGLVMAALFAATGSENAAVAVFAAFSACNADTWASEIGSLSKGDPISILTGKPVRRGMSGGVSRLGLLASLGGAAAVAVLYVLSFPLRVGLFGHPMAPLAIDASGAAAPFLQQLGAVLVRALVILAAGMFGSLFDSLLGALFQPAYRCAQTGLPTERRMTDGFVNERIKGVTWMNNDVVNFLSAIAAAVLVVPIGR